MGSIRAAITHCGLINPSWSSSSGKTKCFIQVGYASIFFDLTSEPCSLERMRDINELLISFLCVHSVYGGTGSESGSFGLWNTNSTVRNAVCFLIYIYNN